jgi:Endonuclease/Exonuclease/phosphatase family
MHTRILFWNSQGVTRKRLELLQLTQAKKVDIILLNETHLPNHRTFNLPNFHSYCSNKPQINNQPPAGGTAILVNRNLIHHHTVISTNSIMNTVVHIHTGNSELRLVAAYKSPKTILQTADIDTLLDTPANTIIAGDLNAKHPAWHSRVENSAGKSLFRYANHRTDIAIAAPSSPTHYPNNPNHLSPTSSTLLFSKRGNWTIVSKISPKNYLQTTPLLFWTYFTGAPSSLLLPNRTVLTGKSLSLTFSHLTFPQQTYQLRNKSITPFQDLQKPSRKFYQIIQ